MFTYRVSIKLLLVVFTPDSVSTPASPSLSPCKLKIAS
jgi:hypothetical protein